MNEPYSAVLDLIPTSSALYTSNGSAKIKYLYSINLYMLLDSAVWFLILPLKYDYV